MKNDLSYQIAAVIMKISMIPALILSLTLCVQAKDSRGQEKVLERKISLKATEEEIQWVFVALEKKTDVRFVYSPEVIDASRKVSIDVNNKELSKVLNKILTPLMITYEVQDKFIILKRKGEPRKASAVLPAPTDEDLAIELPAEIRVKGQVLSATGQPLAGVSVVVRSTGIGTSTDAKGEFSIAVRNEQDVLLISNIGFVSQEIVVGKKTFFQVVLAPGSDKLNEVVVIGYGTQKKVTVTGAVVSVKGDELKGIPTSSVTNTLVGRTPGLIAKNMSGEPGYDDSKLLIRGNNTLGDNSPLVVVDGVADRAGGFSRIDVNDIESVTILKDASAAIYGSRAANGVILVTTKRGRAGTTSISYTFNYGLKQPTVLPKMLNSADYATALNDIGRLIDKNPVPMYTDDEIKKFRDGSDPMNYPNTDFEKTALKEFSGQSRHNLTISGGTEKVKYFTSVGYQYEDNMYKNSASNYKQYNLRSNIDIQANKDLRFFVNLSLRQEDRNSPWDGAPVLWRNIVQGDPRQLIQYPNGLRRAVTSGGYNPLTAVDGSTGYQHDKRSYINGDLGFNWDFSRITKGLGLVGGLYVDKSNIFYKSFNKTWTLYTLDNSTNQYVANQYGPTNALENENMNQSLGITANMRLTYNRTFKGVHNVGAFVAYEQYTNNYDYLRGQRQNYVSTAIDQLFAGDTKGQINDGTATQSARQNYFGRLDYAYAEKYLLQFNWRYDGSENFPKANRFGFFPGVSLGWRASEEKFWQDHLSFINYFKIRGSYGKMGNDKINYNGADQHFTYMTNYTFGNNAILGGANPVGYTGIVQVQTGNPNVTWEVATTYNLGFESRLLDNSISLEVDIFRQKRDKILAQAGAVVPLYAGLSLPAENVGSCESKGFEATLGYTKNFGQVHFNISGNISYARSKVLNFNEAAATPAWQKQTGKPIGAKWLMYEATGIYRTAGDLTKYPGLGNADVGDLIFRDVDKNSVLDGNDMVRQDRTETPEIIYGTTVGVTYKGFDLSMLWQGARNVASYVFYEGGGGGIGDFTQDYFDHRWTPENPNSQGPRIYDRERTSVGKMNTYFLHDASYLRLKNLEIGYALPRGVLSKASITGCRIFLSGYNLLTFTGVKDIDPEATASDQNYAGWFNIQSRIFSAGVNVTF
jgi:TonB-linked SusC/RagA family outer membrane protein